MEEFGMKCEGLLVRMEGVISRHWWLERPYSLLFVRGFRLDAPGILAVMALMAAALLLAVILLLTT